MIFMKKNLLLLLLLITGLCARSQTFTVVNNSKTVVYFQIFASDKNSCNKKFSSMVAIADPSSTIVYGKTSEIKWSGELPGIAAEYSAFKGTYTDPSGACVSEASNVIGDDKCKTDSNAIINTAKCGGTGGNLNLSWSSKNGNVLVTIN